MEYFTADTHLGHKNIIKYCNRPFHSIDEMDEVLLDNINSVVQKHDTLYHLGDFSFGYNSVAYFRERIKCDNVFLILGNHDRLQRWERRFFQGVYDYLDIKVQRQNIVMMHYAMRVWNKSHHGAWHLYGHSHGSLPDDPNTRSFDIGVDCHDYKPLSLEQVRDIMDKKSWQPLDHHTGN